MMAVLAHKQFIAESPYNSDGDGQWVWVYLHSNGTVNIQAGAQVQTTIALTHEGARKLAENILAIVPAPVEAEVA
jgi:hypothetical protein